MRWLCAAVMWPMLACQPFDDVGVVGQGDSLIAASETRFFSLYGVTSTEVKVVLARDVAGAALALEGQTVEGLLLPPDEYCLLKGIAAYNAVVVELGSPVCRVGEIVENECVVPCRTAVWSVSVR